MRLCSAACGAHTRRRAHLAAGLGVKADSESRRHEDSNHESAALWTEMRPVFGRDSGEPLLACYRCATRPPEEGRARRFAAPRHLHYDNHSPRLCKIARAGQMAERTMEANGFEVCCLPKGGILGTSD